MSTVSQATPWWTSSTRRKAGHYVLNFELLAPRKRMMAANAVIFWMYLDCKRVTESCQIQVSVTSTGYPRGPLEPPELLWIGSRSSLSTSLLLFTCLHCLKQLDKLEGRFVFPHRELRMPACVREVLHTEGLTGLIKINLLEVFPLCLASAVT